MATLPPILDGSKFYFQGQKLLLTYPHIHIEKEALLEFIAACAGLKLKFVRAAHETGHAAGIPYQHTHVLIDFGQRFQTRDCRRFDWNSQSEFGILHPNFRPVKSAAHWRNCTQYLAKEDSENQDLLVRSLASQVWNAESLQDVMLNHCEKASDATGLTALWAARPALAPEVDLPNRPWQQAVLGLIRSFPHKRTIHWFYDPIGDTGKTWLSRYLMANKLAYSVKQCCGSYHFATIIQNAIGSGWDQRCFIFDLPRSMEDLAFYGPLEEVKDGHVTAVKYQGGSLIFRQPHVLVFANFLPNREKLSGDRWRVHQILPDYSLLPPLEVSVDDSLDKSTESGPLNIIKAAPPDNILSDDDIEELIEEALSDLPQK